MLCLCTSCMGNTTILTIPPVLSPTMASMFLTPFLFPQARQGIPSRDLLGGNTGGAGASGPSTGSTPPSSSAASFPKRRPRGMRLLLCPRPSPSLDQVPPFRLNPSHSSLSLSVNASQSVAGMSRTSGAAATVAGLRSASQYANAASASGDSGTPYSGRVP